MNRSDKHRRAGARQSRETRKQIRALLAANAGKPLQRFQVSGGVVTNANVLYSDEESE